MVVGENKDRKKRSECLKNYREKGKEWYFINERESESKRASRAKKSCCQ